MKINKLLPVIVLFIATTLGCVAQQKENIQVISPKTAKFALEAEENPVLVDVRMPEEFSEGNIEGAENINFHDADFKQQMAKFDREKPVYIYCRSGVRSAKAAKQLQEMGFKEIYDIEGGYLDWEK